MGLVAVAAVNAAADALPETPHVGAGHVLLRSTPGEAVGNDGDGGALATRGLAGGRRLSVPGVGVGRCEAALSGATAVKRNVVLCGGSISGRDETTALAVLGALVAGMAVSIGVVFGSFFPLLFGLLWRPPFFLLDSWFFLLDPWFFLLDLAFLSDPLLFAATGSIVAAVV